MPKIKNQIKSKADPTQEKIKSAKYQNQVKSKADLTLRMADTAEVRLTHNYEGSKLFKSIIRLFPV